MFRVSTFRLAFALIVAMALLVSSRSAAQDVSGDDPNETPLGDIARNLRNSNPAPREAIEKDVIDNDNLTEVMNQAENRHRSLFRFLMSGDQKNFRVAAPDVTCSLSFTAGTKALLSEQYAQMNLPSSEIAKLTGPATVEGDAFSVALFNGTEWHVSEIDVAFTLVTRNFPDAAASDGIEAPEGFPHPSFQAGQNNLESDGVRPEKKADRTVIYKMRAAAPPLSASTFSAPLNLEVAPGQDWHWSIVEAKGYPPQNRLAATEKTDSANAHLTTPAQAPDSHPDAAPAALTQPQ